MAELVFRGLLAPSCAGALLAILLLLFRPVTEKYASAHWHYRIWLCLLLLMVLPLRLPSPDREPPSPVEAAEGPMQRVLAQAEEGAWETTAAPSEKESRDGGKTAAFLWLGGALLSLGIRLGRYTLFRKSLFRLSKPSVYPAFDRWGVEKLPVRSLPDLHSPMLVGLFRPVLFLPEQPLSQTQLHHVLVHELTHWKRGDLFFKWLALGIKCLHWFNPLVYVIARKADFYGEISCDLTATQDMTTEERKEYIRTILALAAPSSHALAAGLTGPYKTLSRRFYMIQHRKSFSPFRRMASALLAGALLFSGGLASAAGAWMLQPPEEIVAWNGEEKLEFENKPFAAEGTVYFPLRETLEQFGVMDHPDSTLTYRDGVVELTMAWNMGAGVAIHHCRLAIGSDTLVENSQPTATGVDLSYSVVLPYAPVLKGGVTYVPYQLLRALSVNQTFASFSFETLDETGEILFTLPPIATKSAQ